MSIPDQRRFYTIEISYKSQSSGKWEVSMFRLTNFTAKKLMDFRESVFIGGAYRKIDGDTGEVISPWNILSIMVYKQAHFFNAEEEDKALTKKE
jgi:hypothetical protein